MCCHKWGCRWAPYLLLQEEGSRNGDCLLPEVSCCQRLLQGAKIWPRHYMSHLQRLEEYFVVLHMEQSQKRERENGLSEALVEKARTDTQYFFDQRHTLGGCGVRVFRAEEHHVEYLPHLYLGIHFVPGIHWGELLVA